MSGVAVSDEWDWGWACSILGEILAWLALGFGLWAVG